MDKNNKQILMIVLVVVSLIILAWVTYCLVKNSKKKPAENFSELRLVMAQSRFNAGGPFGVGSFYQPATPPPPPSPGPVVCYNSDGTVHSEEEAKLKAIADRYNQGFTAGVGQGAPKI